MRGLSLHRQSETVISCILGTCLKNKGQSTECIHISNEHSENAIEKDIVVASKRTKHLKINITKIRRLTLLKLKTIEDLR